MFGVSARADVDAGNARRPFHTVAHRNTLQSLGGGSPAEKHSHLQLLNTSDLRTRASCRRAATISSAVGPKCLRGVMTGEAPLEWSVRAMGTCPLPVPCSPAQARPRKQRGESGVQKASSGVVRLVANVGNRDPLLFAPACSDSRSIPLRARPQTAAAADLARGGPRFVVIMRAVVCLDGWCVSLSAVVVGVLPLPPRCAYVCVSVCFFPLSTTGQVWRCAKEFA